MEKVLVIGAALSGIAAAQYLNRRGYEVYLTDSKPLADKEKLEAEGIKVYDGGHPDFLKDQEYSFIVKNPGIKYSVPFIDYFVRRNDRIINETEFALADHPLVRYGAITGTNGKTTTTTLLGELLKTLHPDSVACGNIGLPVSAVLDHCNDQNIRLAIEIAGFQLVGLETFKPQVSVIMNLTPDHLDYFGTVDAYYRAKTLVYKNQDENDWFLKNIDDPNIMAYCPNEDIKAKVIEFSLEDPNAELGLRNGKVCYGDIELFELANFKLVGMHNVQNAMVAACMAYLMGVDLKNIKEVIENFQGVEHRIEFVRELDGVRYYNDSKGTNVDSTIVALKAFDQPVHLLVGGYDKGVPFDAVKPYLGNVRKMYAFGVTKHKFPEIFDNVELFENMHDALEAAHREAKSGEVVLLSPMCASWDQFPNFEVRGKLFKEQVNSYLPKDEDRSEA